MSTATPKQRPSALVIVAFVLEIVLLVLFIPTLTYSEVLQAEGPQGRSNAIALAVTLLVVAIVLVIASVVGYRRDRRAGASIGLAIGAIGIGALLAVSHAGIMLPGALT